MTETQKEIYQIECERIIPKDAGLFRRIFLKALIKVQVVLKYK